MKIKSFFIVSMMFLFLVSCGQSQEDIDAAKSEMLGNSGNNISQEDVSTPHISSSDDELIGDAGNSGDEIQIESMTPQQFLSFDDILVSDFSDGEVEITGTTNRDVDSIEVTFSNAGSDFKNDSYKLQTFKSGDTTFKYFASSSFQVFDYGVNTYIFRAKSGNEVSETKLTLRFDNPENDTKTEVKGEETQLIGDEDISVLLDLPTSSKYGEPVKLGESGFTYSGIKGFEVKKEIIPEISCEELSDYLKERLTSWYYWNTCRDIVKEKGIRFNVIRISGDEYIYERHYADFTNGLYGTYELERGEGVTRETIGDKNTELKDKEFKNVEIVDGLMKDILQS